MNGRKNEIIKPYGTREMVLDIIIGAQAGIIFAQNFMEDINAEIIIITAIMAAILTIGFHEDITRKWNRKMYLKNKKRRKARRIYIESQQEKTKEA
jgi:hypothetical protein